jgi:hypothetical protein
MVVMVCLEPYCIETMVNLDSTIFNECDIYSFAKYCECFNTRDISHNLSTCVRYGECGYSHFIRIPQRKKITIRIIELWKLQ